MLFNVVSDGKDKKDGINWLHFHTYDTNKW